MQKTTKEVYEAQVQIYQAEINELQPLVNFFNNVASGNISSISDASVKQSLIDRYIYEFNDGYDRINCRKQN